MIHEFGVRTGRISLNRMVELLSTNPAKLFGLYPRKGTIAPGSDADIVIFDPERRHLITAADQHSKVDYNLYEGTEVDRVAGDRAAPRERARRRRRARRGAGCGRVRRAGRLRAGAPARSRSLTTSCAERRRTPSPLSGALRADVRYASTCARSDGRRSSLPRAARAVTTSRQEGFRILRIAWLDRGRDQRISVSIPAKLSSATLNTRSSTGSARSIP